MSDYDKWIQELEAQAARIVDVHPLDKEVAELCKELGTPYDASALQDCFDHLFAMLVNAALTLQVEFNTGWESVDEDSVRVTELYINLPATESALNSTLTELDLKFSLEAQRTTHANLVDAYKGISKAAAEMKIALCHQPRTKEDL